MKAKKKSMDCNYCIGSDWVLRRFYFGYKGEKDKQEQTNTQTRTQEKEIRAQGEMKDGELVDYTKIICWNLVNIKGGERLPLRRPRRKFIRQFYWRQRTGRKKR